MRKVERQFFVRASPREVFRAISTAQGLSRWMVEHAEIALEKGGKYRFEFPGGWVHEGVVLRLLPGRLLSLSWSWKGVRLAGTELTLSVSRKGDGSLFKVTHTGFPQSERWTDLYGGAEWGWTYYAMNLKSVLEAGHDLRSEHDG